MVKGIRVGSEEEGDGDKEVMALATRVECNEVGDGFGGKRYGNKGGRQARTIRGNSDGDEVGNGNGNEGGRRQRGQWQWWQEQWRR